MTRVSGAMNFLLTEINPIRMKMYAPGNHMALSLTVYTQRLQSAVRVIAGKLPCIPPQPHILLPLIKTKNKDLNG